MKEESISDKYYNLLLTEHNVNGVLVSFLKEVLEIDTVPDDFYGFIGRLVRLYGRDVVFSSILSVATVDIDSSQNIKPYLAATCKRIFMEKFKDFSPINDLTPKARRLHRRFYERCRR